MDFQSARFDLIHRYRDLETVFDVMELPARNDRYNGYQLIRGALAACVMNCSFCVFCDARRPDLVEAWYRIMCAVRLSELCCRLKLFTWQELATVPPGIFSIFWLRSMASSIEDINIVSNACR